MLLQKSTFTFVILLVFMLPVTLVSAQTDSIPKEDYNISIGKSIHNKKLWSQPYRYEDKVLQTLSVQVNIEKLHRKADELDFNLFALTDEEKKWRIRPVAIYYYRTDRKIYLKSKADNRNYEDFEKYQLDGYTDFEAKTYKTNTLGIKKKRKEKPTVQSLDKMKISGSKITYYLDFPVRPVFDYGKVYFKDKIIGYTGVKH
ncbi:hypothetical protein UMM65_07655 [Aureibaculum sp. 2210JD6-5]|uniref:hypothetical protein n=1 Tax=Aureibaculum sp. 2210JD6-5 TaxID=3103957 RepID=UPI002AAE6F99|nr:hypothetical protein [Aureibaculum sp. 2210JD6-5]MDY7395113.1 hypothetical protein [Aureibaculum sp. 2210JD6-5]